MTKLTVETVTIEPITSMGPKYGNMIYCRYESEDGSVTRGCESWALPIGKDPMVFVECLEHMAKMIREDVIYIDRKENLREDLELAHCG